MLCIWIVRSSCDNSHKGHKLMFYTLNYVSVLWTLSRLQKLRGFSILLSVSLGACCSSKSGQIDSLKVPLDMGDQCPDLLVILICEMTVIWWPLLTWCNNLMERELHCCLTNTMSAWQPRMFMMWMQMMLSAPIQCQVLLSLNHTIPWILGLVQVLVMLLRVILEEYGGRALAAMQVANTGEGERNRLERARPNEEGGRTVESSFSSENGRETETEWVEQDDPGVYITLTTLSDGGRDLKRVRFR